MYTKYLYYIYIGYSRKNIIDIYIYYIVKFVILLFVKIIRKLSLGKIF